jgi:hypothetical protein
MLKILKFLKQYWYLPIFVLVLGGYLWKKKKSDVTGNKDEVAKNILSEQGVKEEIRQNYFTNLTAQLAEALGTSYGFWHYGYYTENDAKVYELMKDLNATEFKVVSKLYFETYAKGRSLSEDLAKLLDAEYYQLLKVK